MNRGDTSDRWESKVLSVFALMIVYVGAILVLSPTVAASSHPRFDTAAFTSFNCGDEKWGPDEESAFSAAVPQGADYVTVGGDVRTEHMGEGYGDSNYYDVSTSVSENSNGVWELQVDITNPGTTRDSPPERCQGDFEGDVLGLPSGEQRLKIIVQSNIDDNTREYTQEINVPESDGGGDDGSDDDDDGDVSCPDEDDDDICDQNDDCIDQDGDTYGEGPACTGPDECPNDDSGHILTADGECVTELPSDDDEEEPTTEPGGLGGGVRDQMRGMPLWQKIVIGAGMLAAGVFTEDIVSTGEDESVSIMQRVETASTAKNLLCSATSAIGGSSCRGGPFGGMLGTARDISRRCSGTIGQYSETRQEVVGEIKEKIRECERDPELIYDVASIQLTSLPSATGGGECINIYAKEDAPDIGDAPTGSGPAQPPKYPNAPTCKFVTGPDGESRLYDSDTGSCVDKQEFLNNLPGPDSGNLPNCPNINY